MKSASQQPKRILIVDDEAAIMTAIAFLLEKEGYAVVQAENGRQALAKAKSFQPEIIILDVMMPGMDGFEVARRIRENDNMDDCRIIFLTARGTQNDRFDGYASGGEVYLTKPFDNDELLTILAEVVAYG